jgi:hypothetical protein
MMTTEPDVETLVDGLFDTICNLVPGLHHARQGVWDSDAILPPGAQDRTVDATVAPATAFWLGYRQASLDLMKRLLGEALSKDDVPWEQRSEVVARLIRRLTTH